MGSQGEREFAPLVEGIGGEAGGQAVADAVGGFVGEVFGEGIEGAVGGGHDEGRGGEGFFVSGQEVADGDTVAVPSGQAVFGPEYDAQLGHAAAGGGVGGGAGDFAANEGFGGDDGHLFALFGQGPGGTNAAPVGAFVIEDNAVAHAGLAAEHLFGGPDIAEGDAGQGFQVGLPALEAGFVGE